MDYKTAVAEFKADSKQGIITGYASRFGNIDGGLDVVHPGAYRKTIQENLKRIKALMQHDHTKLIGVPVQLAEDSQGLLTETKVSKTTLGVDTLILVEDGVLTEMSVGYDTIKADFSTQEGRDVRNLRELKLWEYSFVTWGMNEQASILGAKNAQDLEEVLKRARHLADHGLKAGRVLSKENFSRLSAIVEELQALLQKAQPSEDTDPEKEAADKDSQKSSLLTLADRLRMERERMGRKSSLTRVAEELNAVSRKLKGEAL